jgi:hypothetical protein
LIISTEIRDWLRATTKSTSFVGTYFVFHDNNYNTRTECVI